MDCEKFESTLMDELYDELDEVTSAAAKRHVTGCSRCASLLSGLKATRRLAVLPMVEPPADLEDRILAAAREAQKVVPLTRRASRVISWAGSWAMRPQTAMAALFLLMIGSSALLLKGKHAAPPSTMTVSEQGEPVPSATTGTLERPAGDSLEKDKAAAPSLALVPPAPQAAPTASAASDYRSEPLLDGLLARGRAPASGGPAGRVNLSAAPSKSAPADEAQGFKSLGGLGGDRDDTKNAATVAGAPAAAAPAQHYAYAPGAAGGGGGANAPATPPAQPAPPPALQAAGQGSVQAQQAQSSSSFNSAMGAYNAGDYATATTLFDGLASSGDLNAALWAARSVRGNPSGGCAQAVPRYDQVMRAGAGTTAGYDATFEAGQCYRQMGQADVAQARFRSLITVPSYVDRAKNELARIGPKAVAKQQQAKPAQQAPAATATDKAGY